MPREPWNRDVGRLVRLEGRIRAHDLAVRGSCQVQRRGVPGPARQAPAGIRRAAHLSWGLIVKPGSGRASRAEGTCIMRLLPVLQLLFGCSLVCAVLSPACAEEKGDKLRILMITQSAGFKHGSVTRKEDT